MLGVSLLAVAGFLGEGPFSEVKHGGSEEGLQVEIQRFARHAAPNTLRFTVLSVPESGTVRLAISREYLESVEISTLLPEPQSVVGGDELHTFEFQLREAGATISLQARPEAMGSIQGRAMLEGRPAVEFKQFVYP